jgi:hypothetical protein
MSRMDNDSFRGKFPSCHCFGCRVHNSKEVNRRRALHKTFIDDEICTARASLSPTADEAEYLWDDSASDGRHIDGPVGGQLALSAAVTLALEKFEHKELTNLIKNEYEVVDSSDSDEEFELI